MRSGDVILVVDIHIVMSFICQKWDQSVQMCFFSLKTENKVKTRVCKQKRCRFIWKKENIRSEEIRRNITTRKIPSDREHYPLSPFSSSRMEEPNSSTFGDISLLSSEIGNVDFDIYLMFIHLESLIKVLAFRFKIICWRCINLSIHHPHLPGDFNIVGGIGDCAKRWIH